MGEGDDLYTSGAGNEQNLQQSQAAFHLRTDNIALTSVQETGMLGQWTAFLQAHEITEDCLDRGPEYLHSHCANERLDLEQSKILTGRHRKRPKDARYSSLGVLTSDL